MNDAFGNSQSVVVFGGTSDIARQLVARLVADRGRSVVLAGRDGVTLAKRADQLRRSVANVQTLTFDATSLEEVEKSVTGCFEAAGEPVDVVIVAIGELGNQMADEVDPDRVARLVTVNFGWPAAALSSVADRLRQQGYGRIIVLSSVAGFRVRRSNFVYGSTKAGLDSFALGLSEALRGTGVSMHVVRPGFVHTKMTRGRPAAPFAVRPEKVVSDIMRGLKRGQVVIWSPRVLGLVFGVLRLAPGALWRRLPG